jgi:hypothetical protein
MAEQNHVGSMAGGSQLRERPSAKPLDLHSAEDAKERVLELNRQEENDDKDDSKKRTYGRTPDGTGMLLYAKISVNTMAAPFNAAPFLRVFVLTPATQSSSCRTLMTWSPSCSRPRNPRTCPTL